MEIQPCPKNRTAMPAYGLKPLFPTAESLPLYPGKDYLPSLIKSETRPAIIIVVTFVFARMQSGIIDASTIRRFSNPLTLPN
ncbi:MAG: hypothetical protein CM1200mP22_25980 [Dehalococcoidia bacterium]|nr:MAG: hypothetical protein CM1200mP22_25980 [Dehalococcoidia bacterium]